MSEPRYHVTYHPDYHEAVQQAKDDGRLPTEDVSYDPTTACPKGKVYVFDRHLIEHHNTVSMVPEDKPIRHQWLDGEISTEIAILLAIRSEDMADRVWGHYLQEQRIHDMVRKPQSFIKMIGSIS